MPEDNKARNVREDHDAVSDPLNPYLADALADLALPALDGIPLDDDAAEELTESDRKALASLGSSSELVAKVIAECQGRVTAERQAKHEAEAQTMSGDLATTQPGRIDTFPEQETSPKYQQLLENISSLEHAERIEYSAEYNTSTVLGRGGQGVVYLAERLDPFAARRALKVFSPSPYGKLQAYNEDMERMLQVALSVHRNPHDDLLDVEWFGKYDEIYVMMMQLIDGCDLCRLLQPDLLRRLRSSVDDKRWRELNNVVYSVRGPGQVALQPAIAVYIIERCLRGLEALHGMGIVHGDIKPANIMLNASGGVKLVDIGSAIEQSAPSQWPTATPKYAAPEFLQRGELTPRSDLASLGYVLIELLSGRPVVTGTYAHAPSIQVLPRDGHAKLLEAKRSLPNRFFDMLPDKARESKLLVEFCRRLVEPDPQDRFPSAAEVIVHPGGSWEFHRQLIKGGLAVCNFRETQQWLADVKLALSKRPMNQ